MANEISDTESVTSSASSSAGSATERLKAPRGAKSKVWKYFGFTMNESGAIVSKTRVKCTICRNNISFCGKTTNLSYHLEQKHPEQFSECCSVKQGTLKLLLPVVMKTSLPSQSVLYTKRHINVEANGMKQVRMPWWHLQRFSTRQLGFLNYSKTLNPLYQPASRTHFSRIAIPSKYKKVKDIVMMSVYTAEYFFTTDLWTGWHGRVYMAITIHYISPDNMQFHHHCITMQEVSVVHNTENLANEIGEVLNERGIRERIYGATTDNAQNIRNAIVDIMELHHLGCIGHTLQLSIDKSFRLTSVAWLLGRVKKLIEHFKRCTKETYLLRDKQILLDLSQHELIQQCDTRWNSTLYMLQHVKEQQPALCSVLLESKDKAVCSLFPDGPEWNLLEDLVTVLEPFEEATKALSGSNYPTISIISPLLYQVCVR